MCNGRMLHLASIKFMTSNNHIDIYDDTKFDKAPNLMFHLL